MRAPMRWVLVAGMLLATALPGVAAIPTDWVIGGSAPGWIAGFEGRAGGFEHADDVAVSPDGSLVFVTGGSESRDGDWDWITMAYDAVSGDRIWKTRYDSPPAGDWDIARAIATGPGGRVFVTGEGVNRRGDERGVTVAYDAGTGRTLWVRRHAKADPAFDQDYVYSDGVELSPDGRRVYVAGTRYVSSPGSPHSETWAAIWAYRASDGKELWATVVDPGWPSQTVNAMTIDPLGRFVVATGESGSGFGTVAVRARDGSLAWFRRYDRSGFQNGVAIAASHRSAFVSGYDRRGTATLAYSLGTGRERWITRYGLDRSSEGAQPSAISVAPDGRSVAITGFWEGRATGADEFAMVLYSAATGRERWVVTLPGSTGWAAGADLVFPATGDRVIAGGYTEPGGIVTVAYALADGTQLWWASAHDGEGEGDGADAITASPDGLHVYVVATTQTAAAGQDFATLAYPA